MKRIYLFTGNDRIIKEYLARFDCRSLPDGLPSGSSEFMPEDTIVYRVSNDSLPILQAWLEFSPMCKYIIVTEKITSEQKDFFLQNGIAYVVQTVDPEKISAYIKAMASVEPKNAGKMLVYDDRENVLSIVQTITSHFGYETVFVDSADNFFKSITENTYHFVFINLGCGDLDIAAFVRGCHSHPKIKASPLIAYKDTIDALFINELISGINRYISYILSPQELYSFLLDILFRKEFMPLIRRLNTESHFTEFSHFCEEPLGRIYYGAKDKILTFSDILSEKNIFSISSAVSDIEKSLIGVSALNWLRLSEEKTSIEKTGYLCNNTFVQTLDGQTPAADKL